MVHRLVLTVGGTGIGGLGDPFLAAAPLPVSSSGPTASRQATSMPHRPHWRSARTVSGGGSRPPDRWRQVAAEPATQAGQGTRRHPVEEAEAKVGPTVRTWRSSPVAGRCRNAEKSTTSWASRNRGGQPDLHPQRDAGVSAGDEQRSQQIPLGSPGQVDPRSFMRGDGSLRWDQLCSGSQRSVVGRRMWSSGERSSG
jgi:hypothetical protein